MSHRWCAPRWRCSGKCRHRVTRAPRPAAARPAVTGTAGATPPPGRRQLGEVPMSEIVMPRLSDTMEEGTVLRWLKRDGEHVHRGEELVEIETDKAAMVYESDQEGLLRIVAREGDTLAVGATIAHVGEEAAQVGEGAAHLDAEAAHAGEVADSVEA